LGKKSKIFFISNSQFCYKPVGMIFVKLKPKFQRLKFGQTDYNGLFSFKSECHAKIKVFLWKGEGTSLILGQTKASSLNY